MNDELEAVRKYRKAIPEAHRASLGPRVRRLRRPRFGSLHTLSNKSTGPLDQTACTLVLQAVIEMDLNSIELIFQRLEGGAQGDETVAAGKAAELIL